MDASIVFETFSWQNAFSYFAIRNKPMQTRHKRDLKNYKSNNFIGVKVVD